MSNFQDLGERLDERIWRVKWWWRGLFRQKPEPSRELITPQWITRETLRIISEKSDFLGLLDRSYEDEFKKGATINIRRPSAYTGKSDDEV